MVALYGKPIRRGVHMTIHELARRALLLSFVAGLLGCPGNAVITGIRPTPAGSGPVVNWDPLHRPLPEIPLPNDVATYPDPGSPTDRPFAGFDRFNFSGKRES